MKAWANRILVLLLFAALVLVLLAYQGLVLHEEHPSAEVPGPADVQAAERTARVERRVLPRVEVHPGFVEPVEPATLAPRVMATVLSIAVREGDAVESGARLVALDDRDSRAALAQAEAALAEAGAHRARAELAFERADRLHGLEAATTQEWEAAREARDAARAREARAGRARDEAEAALSWFEIDAPFAGRVLERFAEPGDLATPGRPLLALYRADRLRLRVAVPEKRAAELAVGGALDVTFDGLPPRGATLTRVLPAADPSTGTVTLHVALDRTDDLRPGKLGRLRLEAGAREALVVPATAVERVGQVERVRLVRDGAAEAVTVRVGKRHGELVEVLSGLSEGEEVLLR